MKIAYLSLNLFPTHYAHSVQIMRMCEAFTSEGHEVVLYAWKSELYISDEMLFDEYGVRKHFKIIWVTKSTNSVQYIFSIYRIIKESSPGFDICFTRHYYAALVCHTLKIKCIYEIHNVPLSKSWKLSILITRNSKSVFYLFISTRLSELYVNKYELKQDSYIIIHDGAKIDITYDIQIPSEIKMLFHPTKKNILYIGSFYRGRGIDIIIELAKLNSKYNFICIGGTSNEYPDTNISNMRFYGRIANALVPGIIKLADVLLMPYSKITTIEGKNNTADFCSPMKLGEYLVSARPIISSSLPALTEILTNNINAVLCEPDNIQEWNDSLNRLLDNEKLQLSIGIQAFETAKEISWDKRVNNIAKFILSK